jgi:hypothetical protein
MTTTLLGVVVLVVACSTSTPRVSPVRDSANVDARRAVVGLPPLREYLRVIDSSYTPRARR